MNNQNALSYVQSVLKFNELAGTKNEYNVRILSTYVGLIAEEFAELIEAIDNKNGNTALTSLKTALDGYSIAFRKGYYDDNVAGGDRVGMADALVDINVVSIGGLMTNGFDVDGSLNEVARSNMSKGEYVDGEYVLLKDETGKITKGSGYFKPELSGYQLDKEAE